MAKQKYIFEFQRAPGDVLMLTALVRDLKLTYGDEFAVDVRAPYPNLWEHNPYLDTTPGPALTLNFDRGHQAADREAIRASQRGGGQHYLTAFHRAFTAHTGIAVEPLFAKPDVHLTAAEKAQPPLAGRYWLIVPGYKIDITNKAWPVARYQAVVDCLRAWGLQFVQEGTDKPKHVNPPLTGVLNVVGTTSIRGFMHNLYHAEGIICGCSLPMHLAAALEKPCVVLLGGREEPAHEAYVNSFPGSFGPKAAPVAVPHRVLHTLGQLDCCATKGCWLRRTEAISQARQYNTDLCRQPVGRPAVPHCMHLIEPSHVVEAVMSYYQDGTLPPLPSWA